MKIGIGLPATIPGARGDLVLEWARRADERGFSSLGIIGRLVYSNYDPLTTLAACASVTTTIRLMTTVLLAPLRSAAILAKEAATIDNLSNGRLTLGLGVGAREDDFEAAGVPFHRRGALFDRQLETMHRIWAQDPIVGGVAIGPPPVQKGGPEILIGGYSTAAIQRVEKWGSGYISGGAPAEVARNAYQTARESWQGAGREGEIKLAAGRYFALGPDAGERGAPALIDYYGAQMGGSIAGRMPVSRDALRREIDQFTEIGAGELIYWPTVADLGQIDLLAEAIA